MIYFIGAGPGAVDLITVRGAEILRSAGRIVYAGSLVNPEIIAEYSPEGCEVFDSSSMTLEEISDCLISGHESGLVTVRLHSGDPAIFGAIREQMNILRGKNIPFEVVPGVSSLFAASSAVKTEYMIPSRTQTLIITRHEGRTPVPESEGLKSLAVHGASMAVFLSAGMLEAVCAELISGGYEADTPAAVVYRASWPDERVIRGTLATLPGLAEGITKSAIILAGDFLGDNTGSQSKLYDKNFSHEYRPSFRCCSLPPNLGGTRLAEGGHRRTEDRFVITAFTHRGVNLALRLAEFLGGEVFAPERFSREGVNVIGSPLTEWAGKMFRESRAIIFIGACGIAVRAVAPCVRDKMTDPAVVSVDEGGKFVIPLLSGHVGGANGLARKIAAFLHAVPVITTATDVNNLPAVDEWAVKNNCVIENPGAVKKVSAEILEGESVGVAVTCENIPVPFPVTLMLRPRVLILGAGCNRGVSPAEFESSAIDFLKGAGVSVLSLKALATVDIKRDEPAMKIFAENHNIPLVTFTASELNALAGNFTASETVRRFTGTDNVCERACVLSAGEGGVLMRSKTVYNGITFALARSEYHDTESR